MLQKLLAFLAKANSEGDGSPSHMRTTTFYTILQWSPAITFGFVFTVIYYPAYMLAYLGIIMAGLLGLLGIKNSQKGKENEIQ